MNAALLERWLPRGKAASLLKTDLFDEAVTDGLSRVLAGRAAIVIGVDLSPLIVRAAAGKHPSILCMGADVRRLPIESGSIDIIVSLSTLDHFEHAGEMEQALGELHRVLSPGGTLLLTLDNLANPIIAVRNALPFGFTHGVGLVPYPVGRTYGPGRVERLVRDAGFSIEERDAIMHAPRVFVIPTLALLRRSTGPWTARVLRALAAFEHLGRLPTRFLTGHFIAIKATKPPSTA